MPCIEAADYFVPKEAIDLNLVPELYGLTKNELKVFTRLYGLEKIPTAREMSLQELIRIPVEKMMQDSLVDPEKIKIIIRGNQEARISSHFT